MSECATLPHDERAEQAVLASMLLSPRVARDLAGRLTEASFYRTSHRTVFRAIVEMVRAEIPIDIVTLRSQLFNARQLDLVGGEQALMGLFGVTPTAVNAEHYATQVEELRERRALWEFSQKLAAQVLSGERSAVDLASAAERELLSVTGASRRTRAVRHIGEFVSQAFSEIESVHDSGGGLLGTSTGFPDLDRALMGFQSSDLIVLAGRPSMGKTAFATDLFVNASTDSAPGLFFSAEQSGVQIAYRRLAERTGLSMSTLRGGKLRDRDWPIVAGGAAQLTNLPLWVNDTPNIPVTDLLAHSRRWAIKHRPGLIVVDYIQLLTGSDPRAGRVAEVSEITRKLKGLARELDCPVLALSQLSRDCEKRKEGKRPVLSDLRDSGSIEQDADVVLFLYRDEVYNKQSPDKGEAEVIVAKQRNGPLTTVRLAFLGVLTTFRNRAPAKSADGGHSEEVDVA